MIPWLSNFFFNPWLVAGAGAVAGPIIIHILSRRKFRTVQWAAMDFLLQAQKKNRRRVRMEQWIVLALRCLAVFLLAMAIARPYLGAGWLGRMVGGSSVEHVLIIDDSLSMAYSGPREGGVASTSFATALDAAKTIVQQAAGAASGDAMSVYLTSRSESPVVSIPNLSDQNRIKVEESLNSLSPTESAVDLSAACSTIANRIVNAPVRATALVYFLSDFQRKDWAGGVSNQGPSSHFADAADEEQSVKCFMIDVGGAEPVNFSIDDIRVDRAQVVSGVPVRVDVAVTNHSKDALRDVEIGVAIEGRRMPPVAVAEILPGETMTEPVEVVFPEDGGNYVEFEIMGAASRDDGLATDNRRAAALDVVSALNVLIVNGEPSADVYRDEAYLLRTALRPVGRATSGVDVNVVDETEFDAIGLESYHVVIFANVARLSPSGVERIEMFAKEGGGVVWFAGDLIDQTYYNESLFRRGDGPIPLSIVEFAETPGGASAVSIGEWDATHPILRGFAGDLGEILKTVRFDAYVRLDDPELTISATGTVEGETATTSPTINDVKVLARLADSYQSPLIVEKPYGNGHVVFIATSADQEWNDWASNFSFLPLMLETVQYIARADSGERTTVVGGDVSIPVDLAKFEADVAVRTPAYPAEPDHVVEIEKNMTKPAARFTDAEKSGLYQFRLKPRDGGEVVRFAAVNVDARESDLRKASAAELTSSPDPKLKIEYFADVNKLVRSDDTGRTELWWPILIAVVGVLMTEHFLACRFGAR